MKILNVTTMVGMRGGDLQMYTVYKLLQEKNDLKQFILCPQNSDLAKMCGIEKMGCRTYKKNKFRFFNTIKAIIKICKQENIDVIHVHDSTALTYTLIAIKFLPSTIKIVLSRKRNNRIKDKFLNRYKYSHPRIVKIISVSKAVEAIFDHIIPDKGRLVTIYDAIDVASFANRKSQNLLHQKYGMDNATKIVGNIAGLSNQKDIFTFIDTAKIILETKPESLAIKFVIIGTGVLWDELHEYTRSKGLEDSLIFTGYQNNVPDLLPEFDVFLLTSLTEGLPLTVYEAFSCKVPVVSTDAGGIREVVKNNETGFLTDIKDSKTLAEYTLKVLTDSEVAKRITENAFRLVQENHDVHVIKENYYQFYKSL
ncbi:glycosyltransferase involved in cell wall biosynthesis [Flavobacterium gossypii]|uniref:Glycosyltransferase involved in cell wall biosynthesis n=1 Tax=Flavobacterium gossypii TaxID=1646119 RepID=A0ABR6DKV9_9FLAO|nr:glycosyltransferase family 4 protein [Flavobacterium gossypii]MBA9072312.1 glycosyltransferase involved in cell wall biosynthesis [Flavobacterium gossypii]